MLGPPPLPPPATGGARTTVMQVVARQTLGTRLPYLVMGGHEGRVYATIPRCSLFKGIRPIIPRATRRLQGLPAYCTEHALSLVVAVKFNLMDFLGNHRAGG